jgi:DNA polymerase-3 subunit alpha
LDKTYGVAIYQEQLMQIARDLAGFTLGEADVLRKAIAKKIAKLLAEQKTKFINGCVHNKISYDIAEKVFNFIEPFAGYGFNRSHAACYAMIAYQTAYLKANWPTQFMAALLTSDYGNTDRIAIEVQETELMGIKVLPPDINESFSTFTVVKESLLKNSRIRFGLSAIKNVGDHVVRVIINERKESGHYLNLEDFLSRIQDKDLNKKSLESLIKTGALDSFSERNLLLNNIENLLNYAKLSEQEKNSGQTNLFGQLPVQHIPKLTLNACPPLDSKQKLAWEKQLLGLYISSHPLKEYQGILERYSIPFAKLHHYINKDVKIIGILSTFKKIFTRKGEPMVFARFEDSYSHIEALLFPKIYQQYKDLIVEDSILEMRGKISDKEGEMKILVEEMSLFDPNEKITNQIFIKIPVRIKKSVLEEIKNIFKAHPGTKPVYLLISEKKINTNLKCSDSIKKAIEKILGNNTVSVL